MAGSPDDMGRHQGMGRAHGSHIPLAERGQVKDPVCGMMVSPTESPHHAFHDGKEYHFCSAGCRDRFVSDPGRYAGAAAPHDAGPGSDARPFPAGTQAAPAPARSGTGGSCRPVPGSARYRRRSAKAPAPCRRWGSCPAAPAGFRGASGRSRPSLRAPAVRVAPRPHICRDSK